MDRTQLIPTQLAENVSRETLKRLILYADMLVKWNRKINLISHKTVPVLWNRHFLDSAQIFDDCMLNPHLPLLDLGSGAGFPGLVLAAMGRSDVHLLDADQRKCTFLRTVAREIGVNVSIHNVRLDALQLKAPVGVITARAFADLSTIFHSTQHLQSPETIFVLNKGVHFANELTIAEKSWTMDKQQRPSITDSDAVIVTIQQLKRRETT